MKSMVDTVAGNTSTSVEKTESWYGYSKIIMKHLHERGEDEVSSTAPNST